MAYYNRGRPDRRNNNNKNNEKMDLFDDTMREVNSLLDINSDEIKFDEDRFSDNNHGNKNNSNNRNNRNYNEWNNPVCKFLSNESAYDRDDMYDALVKKRGLAILIDDLKRWKKDPKRKKPNYVYHLMRNIVFASALPDAIDKLIKKDEFGYSELTKKDMNYLMDEILLFLNNSYDPVLVKKYGEDSIESMRKAYTNILYKFNKKKVKKFKDIKNMPDAMAKRLIILTAGKNVHTSIYQLLKLLYKEADDCEFALNNKNILKIFKICYGKSQMQEVIKCLMLERVNIQAQNNMSQKATDLWVTIDQIIRDELEDMSKKDIEKVIKGYINERKRQERNGRIPRRLGDRRTIHPDDYPKLTKVFENIESRDFSIVSYLR